VAAAPAARARWGRPCVLLAAAAGPQNRPAAEAAEASGATGDVAIDEGDEGGDIRPIPWKGAFDIVGDSLEKEVEEEGEEAADSGAAAHKNLARAWACGECAECVKPADRARQCQFKAVLLPLQARVMGAADRQTEARRARGEAASAATIPLTRDVARVMDAVLERWLEARIGS